jgi:hypothetical protein
MRTMVVPGPNEPQSAPACPIRRPRRAPKTPPPPPSPASAPRQSALACLRPRAPAPYPRYGPSTYSASIRVAQKRGAIVRSEARILASQAVGSPRSSRS